MSDPAFEACALVVDMSVTVDLCSRCSRSALPRLPQMGSAAIVDPVRTVAFGSESHGRAAREFSRATPVLATCGMRE